jgi:hypothetical protein
MARDGFDGLGKMRKGEKPEYKPKPMMEAKPKMGGEAMGDGGAHSMHDHGDGSWHTEHPDGTREEHPHHLAALAHMGHKATGGDKHHVVHHDGMSAHSHSVHEDGQHEDHGEDDAQGALSKFLGEEDGGGPMPQEDAGEANQGEVMGGM